MASDIERKRERKRDGLGLLQHGRRRRALPGGDTKLLDRHDGRATRGLLRQLRRIDLVEVSCCECQGRIGVVMAIGLDDQAVAIDQAVTHGPLDLGAIGIGLRTRSPPLDAIGGAERFPGPRAHIRLSRHPHPIGLAVEQQALADFIAGGIFVAYRLLVDEHAGRAVADQFDALWLDIGRAVDVVLGHSQGEIRRFLPGKHSWADCDEDGQNGGASDRSEAALRLCQRQPQRHQRNRVKQDRRRRDGEKCRGSEQRKHHGGDDR